MTIPFIAAALYAYRCVVQDKRPIEWRVVSPTNPEEDSAQQALRAAAV